MRDLTIEQLKKKKKTLDTELFILIDKFESETGLAVDNVLLTHGCVFSETEKFTVSVSCKVGLL